MEQLPRVNLTRFHGVFAPNCKWREQVTPAKRGQTKKLPEEECSDKSPAERHAAMTWAQRLKRVFTGFWFLTKPKYLHPCRQY